MVIICPYCDIEISEKMIEADDGCCPECGTPITPGSEIYGDEDEENDEFDEFAEELDKEFADDFEFEDDDSSFGEDEEDQPEDPKSRKKHATKDLDDEPAPKHSTKAKPAKGKTRK